MAIPPEAPLGHTCTATARSESSDTNEYVPSAAARSCSGARSDSESSADSDQERGDFLQDLDDNAVYSALILFACKLLSVQASVHI